MSDNPLNPALFNAFNLGTRRAIDDYDLTPKRYPRKLRDYPSSEGDEPIKACVTRGCTGFLRHLRSHLCTECRESSRAATKRRYKTSSRSQGPP